MRVFYWEVCPRVCNEVCPPRVCFGLCPPNYCSVVLCWCCTPLLSCRVFGVSYNIVEYNKIPFV